MTCKYTIVIHMFLYVNLYFNEFGHWELKYFSFRNRACWKPFTEIYNFQAGFQPAQIIVEILYLVNQHFNK